MAKSKLVCKDTALLQFANPGNAYFSKILYLQMRGQSFVEVSPARASRMVHRQNGKIRNNGDAYIIKMSSELFTMTELQAMMNDVNAVQARIVEVIDYPMFVKVADADYNTNAPAYLPNNRFPDDEEGNPGDRKKWSQWKDSTHEHLAHEGFNYIPLNSDTGGEECAVSLGIRLLEAGHDVVEMNSSTWPQIGGDV